MMKRFLTGLLACLMLLSVMASCTKKEPPSPAVSTEGGQESTTDSAVPEEPKWETDENGYAKDRIPETNYGGKEISLLCWKENIDSVLPAEAGKNEVQEQVYLHRLNLESRLNIDFRISTVPGNAQNYKGFLEKARLANEVGYDLICSFSLNPSVLAQEGLLYNLKTLQYPQLDMPWWPESVKEWEQYGSLYFVANNSSVSVIRSMETMFSNGEIFAGRGLKDPVDLVLEGQWTLEKMLEYVKAFDVEAPEESRIYGLCVDDFSRMDAFFYSAGFQCTHNNADGIAELAFTSPARMERITSYIDSLISVFQTDAVAIRQDDRVPMKEHKTALMVASLGNIVEMNDTSYAPIPLPKLTANEPYRIIQNNGFDVWCIPTSAKDPEASGLVLEALASSEYRRLAPFFFEKYMKLRYSSNEVCSQMFELVRSSVVYDFGRISQWNLGLAAEAPWRNCFYDYGLKIKFPQNSFASEVAEKQTATETKLLKLLSSYRKYSNQNVPQE